MHNLQLLHNSRSCSPCGKRAGGQGHGGTATVCRVWLAAHLQGGKVCLCIGLFTSPLWGCHGADEKMQCHGISAAAFVASEQGPGDMATAELGLQRVRARRTEVSWADTK